VTSNSGFRHRAALSTVAVLLAAVASCTSSPTQAPAQPSPGEAQQTTQGQQQPVATKDADWAGVARHWADRAS
jgi:hypothetical protein